MGRSTSHVMSNDMRSSIDLINQMRQNNANVTNLQNQLSDISTMTKVPKLHHTFSDKPNGSVTSIDSGQTFGIWNNPSNVSGYTISDGKLVHGASTGGNGASYLDIPLSNRPTRIGAKFSFPDITNAGNVALCSFQYSLVDAKNTGKSFPSAGIHATISPYSVSLIIFQMSGSINVGSITYQSPLTANKEYSLELYIDGNTIYMILPDGTVTQGFTNSNVQLLSSNYATFELYELDNTKVPAQIISIWADDSPVTKNGNIVSNIDLIKSLQPLVQMSTGGNTTNATDPNTLTSTGFYQMGTSTPNAPTTDAYHLMNINANSYYSVQLAWRMNDITQQYQRAKYNGTWGSWSLISSSGSNPATETTITDANAISGNGFYQSTSTPTNAPTSTDSYHILNMRANSYYTVQYAWKMSDVTKKYRRTMNNSVWGSWVQIVEGGDSVTVTDLNNANYNSNFQCNTNTTNAPTTDSYHIQVISANSNYKIQYAWKMTDVTLKYRRSMNNGTWGSWVAISD